MEAINRSAHLGDVSRVCVGLDVHKDSIAIAVAYHESGSRKPMVEDRGVIAYDLGVLADRLQGMHSEFCVAPQVVYEAGPCGFGILRALSDRGWEVEVIAPTLIPKRPGDRVKTDRRDARELARAGHAGYLQAIWIPSKEQEALRDLVRHRMFVMKQQGRQRQALGHFVMRQGLRFEGKNWSKGHRAWLKDLKLLHVAHQLTLRGMLTALENREAELQSAETNIEREFQNWELRPVAESLCALRGIDRLTATALLAELGDLRRFASASEFMSYLGLVPSEHSSGGRRRAGAITKTGNQLARRLLTESAWTYRFAPRETKHLQRKAVKASGYAKTRSWEAQMRLCYRYRHMIGRGMSSKKVVTAVARELAGFVWDIARHDLAELQSRH